MLITVFVLFDQHKNIQFTDDTENNRKSETLRY